MNSINDLTAQQLRQAAKLKEKITSLEKRLARLIGSGNTTNNAAPLKSRERPRRKMSAAGIARIRAAQKARWAKVRSAS